MKLEFTKLRFIASKDPEKITQALERLPFKVEIKGAPVRKGPKWFLWFTIQDEVDFKNVILD